MSVTFRPRIRWPRNKLLLPARLFGVRVPAGLSSWHVRWPNIVGVTEMNRLARSRSVQSSGNRLATVNGRVTFEFDARFADPAGQWRCLPITGGGPATHGPARFQFRGGEVFLDLTLGIYILNTARPDPNDPLAVQIFAEVYGHELLHVLDGVNIVTNWLPTRLHADPTIARHLVQAQPFTYGTRATRIDQVERDFRDYVGRTVHDIAHNAFAREANRRTAARDAPAHYKAVQDRIDALRARQVNP